MSDHERPPVSVCIVTYNRRELLLNALASVRRQDWPIREIIVVDNASDDGTYAAVAEQYPEVKLFRTHRNLGCPPARNLAMGNARSRYIANLDDDGAFEPDAVAEAMAVFADHPRAGVVMMNVVEEGQSRSPQQPDRSELHIFSGGCNLIRAEVLERCGYFDDRIFRQGEEYGLSIRMFEHGFEIRYAARAVMNHYPPVRLARSPDNLARGGISLSLALVRYAPVSALLVDLPRRLFGHTWLLLRAGAFGACLRMWSGFLAGVPEIWKERKVLARGFAKSRRLRRAEAARHSDS